MDVQSDCLEEEVRVLERQWRRADVSKGGSVPRQLRTLFG